MKGLDLPQLRMVHMLQEFGSPPRLGQGWVVRDAAFADAAALATLLSAAFEDEWDVARVRLALLDDPHVPRTFVIELDGRLVATASYQRRLAEYPECGWLHWVAADPGLQGRGLGYAVAWAVLQEALANRDLCVRLSTDDFRLAAISSYLRLGFQPEICHASHPARWQAVEHQLSR